MLYGARHRGHAAALVLQSPLARLDMARLVARFRSAPEEAHADACSSPRRNTSKGEPCSCDRGITSTRCTSANRSSGAPIPSGRDSI
jgi:hypothetical protein